MIGRLLTISEMVSASLLASGAGVWWLFLLSISSLIVVSFSQESGPLRATDDGCVLPLKRVEMLDVNLASTSYALREIHVRHSVKVGGLCDT